MEIFPVADMIELGHRFNYRNIQARHTLLASMIKRRQNVVGRSSAYLPTFDKIRRWEELDFSGYY